jgi:hypothetical protein
MNGPQSAACLGAVVVVTVPVVVVVVEVVVEVVGAWVVVVEVVVEVVGGRVVVVEVVVVVVDAVELVVVVGATVVVVAPAPDGVAWLHAVGSAQDPQALARRPRQKLPSHVPPPQSAFVVHAL